MKQTCGENAEQFHYLYVNDTNNSVAVRCTYMSYAFLSGNQKQCIKTPIKFKNFRALKRLLFNKIIK